MKKMLIPAALLTVAACAPGYSIDAYERVDESARACEAILADAPEKLGDQERIAVKGDPGIAWGAPAIVLRCGMPRPAQISATAACYPVEGVDWFADERDGETEFTTIGRDTYVSVLIPDAYNPSSDVLAELAATVKGNTTVVSPCV
jgi:hypothetical protein